MAVTIKVGAEANAPEAAAAEALPVQATMELNMRKSLNGDVMIFDHPDIDIVILTEKRKVLALAKDLMSDAVYETQDHLFKYLYKKGIVVIDSVKGGNVYGSIEGVIQESIQEGVDAVQSAIFTIGKFIEEERPYFEYEQKYKQQEDEYLVDPDAEHSTELGEIPHSDKKGSIRPGWVRGPYGMYDLYRA